MFENEKLITQVLILFIYPVYTRLLPNDRNHEYRIIYVSTISINNNELIIYIEGVGRLIVEEEIVDVYEIQIDST